MASDSVLAPSPALRLPAGADAADGATSPRRRAWQQLRQSLRAHSAFAATILAYVGVGWAVSSLASVPVPYTPSLYSANVILFTVTFLVVAGAGYVGHVMIVVRPKQLARHLGAALRDRILTPERLWAALPVLLLLPPMISTFTYFKFLIPHLRPFAFDPQLADWDRALHFGSDPWALLQPALGQPIATAAINFVYHLWLFVVFGVLLWQGFSLSRPRLRMRYLVSFVLMWALLGNVAATLLSSAGPVYYGRITGLADPFAPLMAYLHQASQTVFLPVLDVQEMLWQRYVATDLTIGAGISAMPSLHVATSFSFALLGFAIRRWLGIAFSLFAAAILIGSVHLGWHYAIDGYAGIIGAWAIWWAVGWFLDRPAVGRLLWGDAPASGWQPRL